MATGKWNHTGGPVQEVGLSASGYITAPGRGGMAEECCGASFVLLSWACLTALRVVAGERMTRLASRGSALWLRLGLRGVLVSGAPRPMRLLGTTLTPISYLGGRRAPPLAI